jgi:hypothetical protein
VRRRTWLLLVALPLCALIALVISATQPMQIRVYALGAPNGGPAATLARGQQACEGPIHVPAKIGGARVWGNGVGASSQLEVSVRNAITGRPLADGQMTAPPEPGSDDAVLYGSVPTGSIVRICVTDVGPVPFSLLGSPPTHPQILMSLDGKVTFAEFSLVFLGGSRKSFLAALPTAFSRAALFRFSWVGPWTFWVLAVALLGTIASCAWAVAAAARADSPMEAEPKTDVEASSSAHPTGVAG